MFSIIIFIFVCLASSVSSRRCPYPLPSTIEPCICEVDDQFQISLICELRQDFGSEDFDKIISAFDYNHNIFTFKIDLQTSFYANYFFGQLNRRNVGRLNITHFIMQNLKLNVNGDLIQEGAFEGSYGSIESIHIYNGIDRINGSIDLDNVLSTAGPKLQSLKLAFVSKVRSSTFSTTPTLTEIVLVNSTFDLIPSDAFTGEYLPNIASIELYRGVGHTTIQTNAFINLTNLTSLKITSIESIGMIERGAFSNLNTIKTIDFSGSNIYAIEEDSFLNISSLETFELNTVLARNMTYLPRIISNSPLLTSFKISNSNIKDMAENMFIGTPNLKIINIEENRYLENIVIQDLRELDTLLFRYNYQMQTVTLRNLPSLKQFIPYNSQIKLIGLSEMKNLESIDISNSKLEIILMGIMPNLQHLDLGSNENLTHMGLTSSLHGLIHPNINIDLTNTNIRNLDEFTFRPLIERLAGDSEANGKLDMRYVKLECGCDVQWLVVDIARTDFFMNAYCTDGSHLAAVDQFLLERMCPPDI